MLGRIWPPALGGDPCTRPQRTPCCVKCGTSPRFLLIPINYCTSAHPVPDQSLKLQARPSVSWPPQHRTGSFGEFPPDNSFFKAAFVNSVGDFFAISVEGIGVPCPPANNRQTPQVVLPAFPKLLLRQPRKRRGGRGAFTFQQSVQPGCFLSPSS